MPRSLKLTYWLCAVISPLVMYMIYYFTEEDSGILFELFVLSVGLICNALIVWVTQPLLPLNEKMAIWRKSILVLAISIILLLLLLGVGVLLLFGFSKWNFG